ncbi:CDP-glucose 4,6-dehydratase [bacterium]|jgi:CDP-glucose 4,6-dehydratase|nr:CDP-glucose 4,6-dehydratase [bacterium]
MESVEINPSFWKGRKVFVTGHTGFKGSWISLWLFKLGAIVTGYSLTKLSQPSMYEELNIENVIQKNIFGDICDFNSLEMALKSSEAEIVIHLAAQSLVRESYKDPINTYDTNIMGTVNLLEAARKVKSVKAILNVTSDKCYENREQLWGYHENDAMGGYDPYSSSKGCSELISSAYRNSFLQEAGIALATARSGNVIGGGDWAKDRIVPDSINSFISNKVLIIRNPAATRPWQHVLEPLSGYLILCQQLILHPNRYTEAWNFGPNDQDVKSVSTLADIMVENWGGNAEWRPEFEKNSHEANLLKLDCSKANAILKWKSIWSFEKTIEKTVNWYKAWHEDCNMFELTLSQIEEYQKERQLK